MNLQLLFTPGVITFLVMLVAVPLALVYGVFASDGDLRIMFTILGPAFVFVLMFGLPHYIWAVALATFFIPASIPGLPIPFTLYELILIMLAGKYVIEQVIIRKRGIRPGPAPDWLFLCGLLAVLIFHGVQDRFGMRILGSSLWGGRAYVSIALAVVGYFVILSSRISLSSFRHLPHLILAVGTIDFAIKLTTTLFPSTIPYFYVFYSDVSTAGKVGAEAAIFAGRWGFLGNYGYLLILWGFSTARIPEFFTKMKWLQASAVLLGILFCFASGYRSSVGNAAGFCLVAAWRDLGWKGPLVGLVPLVLACVAAIFIQSAFGLPKIVQRGLVFLPGDWDAEVVKDAKGSNDFRGEVWTLWMNQQFPQAPVLGRGFCLPPEKIYSVLPYLSSEGFGGEYTRNEAFVISGNIHNTLFSVVDRFGLVGGFFFVAWLVVYLNRMRRYLQESRGQPLEPALQWLTLFLFSYTILSLPGALRAESLMVQQIFFVGVFYALLRARQEERKAAAATAKEAQPTITRSYPAAQPAPTG